MSDPVLHLLVGPNGAGKTTLYERVLRPATGLPFVNADVIARQRYPDPVAGSYEAAAEAARMREDLIAARRSFIGETVFSHPSKLDLVERALAAGYLVTLHVVVVPVELTVLRVRSRVEAGGHAVPEDKIRGRYARLWPLVIEAANRVGMATFYDNSRAGAGEVLRLVATVRHGQLLDGAAWPAWTPQVLVDAWP